MLTIKELADRARPTLNPVAATLGPSFPSGHSATAAAFYAGAALLLARRRPPSSAVAPRRSRGRARGCRRGQPRAARRPLALRCDRRGHARVGLVRRLQHRVRRTPAPLRGPRRDGRRGRKSAEQARGAEAPQRHAPQAEREPARARRTRPVSAAPRLLVGPLLRYTGTTTATLWMETDAPAEVEVLGHRARTFHVEGHHYALVVIDDLEPGTVTPYEVVIGGEVVWPPADGRPPSAIHTREFERRSTLVFGSCRVGAPQREPYTQAPPERRRHRRALGLLAEAPGGLGAVARRPRCCWATRSTPTRCRRRRRLHPRSPGHVRSRPARRWPTSRSTPGSTASRGPTPTSAGCFPRCRRR